MFKANPTLAATLRRRVDRWEAVSKSQTGPKLTLLVGVFDLVALINAGISFGSDLHDKNAAWYIIAGGGVQVGSSFVSVVGRPLSCWTRAGGPEHGPLARRGQVPSWVELSW
jgi:hypothetical protein